MQELLLPPFTRDTREDFEEKHLAAYAVRSKDTTRLYTNSYVKCDYRTEFQRDRDRIIHSKAFRRLMYKTQVYMTLERDHYRNRLSHTLEVCQVARSIATYIGLNVDLVEAIALGHDLGHTPFGHNVERVLNNILRNENGFKHNYQGLLIVDFLENKRGITVHNGLNLTNHTRYGILNHTNDTDKVLPLYNNDKDNLISSDVYRSLEAELVNVVDTLTYLCHDLDDARRMDIFYEMESDNKKLFEDFLIGLEKIIATTTKVLEFNDRLNIANIKNDIKFLLVDLILKALIVDLTKGTAAKIKENQSITSLSELKIQKNIVKFDEFEKGNVFKEMKALLYKFVYCSPIAQQMDTKAKFIFESLYNSFKDNPKQLPYKTLEMYEKVINGEFKAIDRHDSGYEFTPERVICNYLAGMTDRYALENHKRMFGAD